MKCCLLDVKGSSSILETVGSQGQFEASELRDLPQPHLTVQVLFAYLAYYLPHRLDYNLPICLFGSLQYAQHLEHSWHTTVGASMNMCGVNDLIYV